MSRDEYDYYRTWGLNRLLQEVSREEIAGMTSPVRCAHCSKVYDLGKVTVTARYTDCSMWKSPCCNRLVDDRGETGWKSTKDYYPISKPQAA